MQKQAQNALARTISPDLIEDWAEQFLIAKKLEGLSPNTIRIYRQQLKHFMTFCEGQILQNVEEISPAIIRKFLLWHSESHNAGGVHAAFRILRTFLIFYERETDWAGNPIHKIRAPKLAETQLAPVELADVRKLISVCENDFLGKRDAAIFQFLLDSGARARELLAIDLKRVNLVTGAIQIIHGKGAKSRTVFTGKKTRQALRAYLKTRHDSHDALWITDNQNRLSYSGLRAILVRRSKQAGIENPSLHSFRRAFALESLRNGADLLSVATLLGHSDLKTVKRYIRLVNDDLRNTANQTSPVDRL